MVSSLNFEDSDWWISRGLCVVDLGGYVWWIWGAMCGGSGGLCVVDLGGYDESTYI